MSEIRQLDARDWQALRDIRLEALDNHPDVLFSPEDEALFPPSRWIAMLSSPDRVYLGVYRDDVLSGIGAVTTFVDTPDEKTAQLTGFYIRETAQQDRTAKPLFIACMRWAVAQGYSGISVAVRDGNNSVICACRLAGFQKYETDTSRYADGSTGLRHKFHMALNTKSVRRNERSALEPERPYPMILGL